MSYPDPYWCDLVNGTTLYCNPSYSLNCLCNATTDADPDVGGPGVISSFIIVAWITILVAMVPAVFEFLEFLDWMHEQKWPWELTSMDRDQSRSLGDLRRSGRIRSRALQLDRMAILRKAASCLLGSLCDLQIVTGLGIVIAGFAQMPGIAFYHESIIASAWWLTINSFFTARIVYKEEDAVKYDTRAVMRQSGVFVSVILGTVFQCFVTLRENDEWNFTIPGRCYLYHDKSWVWFWGGWFWSGGTAFYGFCILMTIIPWTRTFVDGYILRLRRWQETWINLWSRSGARLGKDQRSSIQGFDWSSIRILLSMTMHMAFFTLATLLLSLYWLLLQFLAVFSYGDGFQPLLILLYIGFGFWETFDILDVKLSNRPLVSGSETTWGFGQVLPLVLLIAIIYNTVDAFKGGYTTVFPILENPKTNESVVVLAAKQEILDNSSKVHARSL